MLRFPDGFVWGAATSAYQIEGAVHEDGRGVSIWDTYAAHAGSRRERRDRRRRGRPLPPLSATTSRSCASSGSPPTASRSPGRASSRAARGPANERGLDFYRRLVDALLEAGIEPYPTLFHWDLPQELQDAGGWPERDTAYRFAEYAGTRARRARRPGQPLADAERAVVRGVPRLRARAPRAGTSTTAGQAVAAAHHLMLAHGLAVERMRARSAPGVEFSIVLNLEPHRPASDERGRRRGGAPRRRDAQPDLPRPDPARRATPRTCSRTSSRSSTSSTSRTATCETISAPLDLLGVNYYRPVDHRGAQRAGAGLDDLAGRRADRGRPAGGRAHDDGLGGRSAAGSSELLLRLGSDYRGPAAPHHRERRLVRRPRRARRQRSSTTGSRRLPRRPPARGAPCARGRCRPARLLRLVAARQLRVGGGVQQAVRHRPRRLRDAPRTRRRAPAGTRA